MKSPVPLLFVLTLCACSSVYVREIYPGRYAASSSSDGDIHEALMERCPTGYETVGNRSHTSNHGPIETRWHEKRDIGPDVYKGSTYFDAGPSTTVTVEAICKSRTPTGEPREPQVTSYLQGGGRSCEAFATFLGGCARDATSGGCENVGRICRSVRSSGCNPSSEFQPVTADQLRAWCPRPMAPIQEHQLLGTWSNAPVGAAGVTIELRAEALFSRVVHDHQGTAAGTGIWAYDRSSDGTTGTVSLSFVEGGKLRAAPLKLEVVDTEARVPILRDNHGRLYRATKLAHPR